MTDPDPFNAGFILPTVVKQIKKILDQYPDDGQILKELIQNAEDSGAHEVQFLFDDHTYKSDKLSNPELRCFQGPALYAYNDAVFDDEDWKGIRMLCDSIKESDMTKVGRFGLGFKSVFHMTDLPCIMTGDYIAFLDPHRRYLSGSETFRWKLGHQPEMHNFEDQFKPFCQDIFGATEQIVFSKGHYGHTLFRFPLRNVDSQSQIKDTTYTSAKVEALIKSFEGDAHWYLLFLQHLESIKFYRKKGNGKPELCFEVKIEDACIQQVRQSRNFFEQRVQSHAGNTEPIKTTYPITMDITHYKGSKPARKYKERYLLCQYHTAASRRDLLNLSKALNYQPLVGAAMSLDRSHSNSSAQRGGHLFCALPLPCKALGESITGLPMHINGFFALDQSRHRIKWPSTNVNPAEVKDQALQWNSILVNGVVPKAMVEVVLGTVNHCQSDIDQSLRLTDQDVYACMPDSRQVTDINWKPVLPEFYKALKHKNIFCTSARSWKSFIECIFSVHVDHADVCNLVLETAKENVVKAPAYICSAFQSHGGVACSKVTPGTVRRALQSVQAQLLPSRFDLFQIPGRTQKQKLNRQQCLQLLKFILQDNNYSELCGIQLLPLSNGDFTVYNKKEPTVYLLSSTYPQEMFPNIPHKFLDPNLDGQLMQTLSQVAREGHTQLKSISHLDVPALLRESMPQEWLKQEEVIWKPGTNGHPTRKWLKVVWEYLSKYTTCIDCVMNLPLLPQTDVTQSERDATLIRLSSNKPLVLNLSYFGHGKLPAEVENILRTCGTAIISSLPSYINPHLLEKFINPPTVEGVLGALQKIQKWKGGCIEQIRCCCSGNQLRQLRDFICKEYTSIDSYIDLLHDLPIFETVSIDNASYCVSARQINRSTTIDIKQLPVELPEQLLLVDSQCRTLACYYLGVRDMCTAEVLIDIIFPAMRTNHYSKDQQFKLMSHVLVHLPLYERQCHEFAKVLRTLKFVEQENGDVVAPTDIYDPDDRMNKRLLDANKFPAQKYRSRDLLPVLQRLGMKPHQGITAVELLSIAKTISYSWNPSQKELDRSSALLEYLSEPEFVSKLDEWIYERSCTLYNCLSELKWVPILQMRPVGYPSELTWKGETEQLAKPGEITCQANAALVGSVKVILKEAGHQWLEQRFGWNKKPSEEHVAEHLENIVTSYQASEKSAYLVVIDNVYSYMTQKTMSRTLLEWVWHGDGFTTAENMVVAKPFQDLRPYVYPLPPEMHKHWNLFVGKFGILQECDLVQVLEQIRNRHMKDEKISSQDIERDRDLCVIILNELKKKAPLPTHQQNKLLFPVHVHDEAILKLVPVEDCAYCDNEWLRAGHVAADDLDDTEFYLVNANIPNTTAEALKVPSLMSRMLDPEELDLNYGQSEPLTRRLRALLQDYTDGFAVLKELIQNADDAGATEVKFLYDERHNLDEQTNLIDDGMKECHGRAFWAYNNAVFKKEDFVNITMLSGATKEDQTQKIGRFGLGFNAVYNLTDVPMFISQNNIVILDPHTTHLGKAIRDKSKPGIKLDLSKRRRMIQKLSNQFKPFNGIFDCDISRDAYPATLFRFPLRTETQARSSEICKIHYDHREMCKLLTKLEYSAQSLLLFTQNVKCVTLYHMPESAKDASCMKQLLKIERTPQKILKQPSREYWTSNEVGRICIPKMLEVASVVLQKFLERSTKCGDVESTAVVSVKTCVTEEGKQLLLMDYKGEKEQKWLISSAIGGKAVLEFATRRKNLLPTGGVAVPVESMETLKPIPLEDTTQARSEAFVFCYLPLPIKSGLPVHVNGCFAVTSSRRHLHEKCVDDKDVFLGTWNEALMEYVITESYINMLLACTSNLPPSTVSIFHLWPTMTAIEANCRVLQKSFYKKLESAVGLHYQILPAETKWVGLKDSRFLDTTLRYSRVGDTALQVLRSIVHDIGCSFEIVEMPRDIQKAFVQAGCGDCITQRTVSLVDFYSEFLLPRVNLVPPEKRDLLIIYALEENISELDCLLRDNSCIPVTPNGTQLKLPKELIHPRGSVACLYGPEDARFPLHNENCSEVNYSRPNVLDALSRLGMAKDDISWLDIAERATSVATLPASKQQERVASLLDHLGRKLTGSKDYKKDKAAQQARDKLATIPFLLAMRKPVSCPFQWYGDRCGYEGTFAPGQLYLKKDVYLVCSSELIMDECVLQKLNSANEEMVKDFLQLKSKTVSVEHAVQQLHVLMDLEPKKSVLSETSWQYIIRSCDKIYTFLNAHIRLNASIGERIRNDLSGKNVLVHKHDFYPARNFAFSLDTECPPYLLKVPYDYSQKWETFLMALGVQKEFAAEDFIGVLQSLKEKNREQVLSDEQCSVSVRVAELLASCIRNKMGDCKENPHKYGPIYIPDAAGVLEDSTKLVYDNCTWVNRGRPVKFVHKKVSAELAATLGVKSIRADFVGSCSYGISFGQKEKLNVRLKKILKGYAFDETVLKEMVQNADDAEAKVIKFILDTRKHGDERVFEDLWKPLQGHALCVYNDKPFTERDIEGIQDLGEGSKGGDVSKIGQFGVGFNCVYHITDVPSFLTKGPDIGETLCVFDPNCLYVPGATESEPGRRFQVNENFKATFSDVFHCYEHEGCPTENGAMFRLPLRDEEMAKKSGISNRNVTAKDVNKLFSDFKNSMLQSVLFLDNVKTVQTCKVQNDSSTREVYEVSSDIADADQRSHVSFVQSIKEYGQHPITDPSSSLLCVPWKEAVSTVTVEDNEGSKQTWLVVQRVGFESDFVVPESVKDAFDSGDLSSLPRGGVAVLLQSSGPINPAAQRQLYCSLPLPQLTDMPVHINGCFALDENRRDLWNDGKAKSFRTEWNNTLLAGIVAPAYATLLTCMRSRLGLGVSDHNYMMESSRAQLNGSLTKYHNLFPRTSHTCTSQYMQNVSKALYCYVEKKGLKVLPVVRPIDHNHLPECKHWNIEWYSPHGSEHQSVFFNNLASLDREESTGGTYRSQSLGVSFRSVQQERKKPKDSEVLQEVMLRTGINLLEAPIWLYECLKDSGVKALLINGPSVLQVYKGHTDDQILKHFGSLPCPISQTPLRNAYTVKLLLKFLIESKTASKEENHKEACNENTWQLDRLPLLLTADGYLCQFDKHCPVFLTKYSNLIPRSSNKFVHPKLVDFFENKIPIHRDVFERFNIEALAEYLPLRLAKDTHYERSEPVQSDSVDKRWLSWLWDFLAECVDQHLKDSEEKAKQLSWKEEQMIVAELLAPLVKWALFPIEAKRSVTMYCWLVQMGEAETVVDLNIGDCASSRVRNALEELQLPVPDYNALGILPEIVTRGPPTRKQRLVHSIVATIDNPERILAALNERLRLKSPTCKVGAEDGNVILRYFNDMLDALRSAGTDTQKLRCLPFYMTITGHVVSLDRTDAYVLPASIPTAEMDSWMRTQGLAFLKKNDDLEKLYKCLNCIFMSVTDIYCDFIFQHFELLSWEARIIHLRDIKNKYLKQDQCDLKKRERAKMLQGLSALHFLPKQNGELFKASDFFSPHNEVFKLMHENEDAFPPHPFNEYEWKEFMETIGLVHQLSNTQFIRYAHLIEQEAKQCQTDKTSKKSMILLKHLLAQEDLYQRGVLQQISSICFVEPFVVSEELQDLYQQFGQNTYDKLNYVPFKGAVFVDEGDKQEEYMWTSANLLPSWILDLVKCRNGKLQTFLNQVEASTEPSQDQVVQHAQNITNKVCSAATQSKGNVRTTANSRFQQVMKSVYKFLLKLYSNSQLNDNSRSRLSHISCILVDGGNNLVRPNQTAVEIKDEDQIKPYLYKMDVRLGEYIELFKSLGTTSDVTLDQYGMVLQEIHEHSQQGELRDPNNVECARKAMKGLFQLLKNCKEKEILCKTEELLLLSECLVLHQSVDLVFVDCPHFKECLANFDKPLLIDVKKCKFFCSGTYTDLVMKLPGKLRPQMLSSLVHEELNETCKESVVSCSQNAQELQMKLHHEIFFHSIIRLIRDPHLSEGPVALADEEVEDLRQMLSGTKIVGLKDVKTKLMYKGRMLKTFERKCFSEVHDKHGSNHTVLYIKDSEKLDLEIFLFVSGQLNKLAKRRLNMCQHFVMCILQCPVDDITRTLDAAGIAEDNAWEDERFSLLPKLGSFIPIEDHHLLIQDFDVLEKGEYVGFEQEDPALAEESGCPTYIYAKVVGDYSENESSPLFTRKYQIQVSECGKTILVLAADLYKFHCQRSFCGEVVKCEGRGEDVADGYKREDRYTDIERTKDEVRKILEAAWKLSDESQRKKIVKRLLLSWHPDKNFGHEGFCSEVFKFIQNEISRLEKGDPAWFSESFFNNMSHRATAHQKAWERFQQHYRQSHTFGYAGSSPFTFRSSESSCYNPQPGEARRWLKQAQADLRAAPKDQWNWHHRSFEWACLKCHQAAEKALKAANYTKNANLNFSHNLPAIAREYRDDSDLILWSTQLESLVGDSTRMRYPNRCGSFTVPNEVYSEEMAQEAANLATQIVGRVEQIVEQSWAA